MLSILFYFTGIAGNLEWREFVAYCDWIKKEGLFISKQP